MHFARTLLGLVCIASASACYGYAYGPSGEVVVTSAPYGTIEAAPFVYYGGRQHYYYDHHWYYRDRGHWYFYRNEPYHLREYRRHHYH